MLSGIWSIPYANALAICKGHINCNPSSSAPFVHTKYTEVVYVTFLPQSVTTGIQSTIPSTGLHTFDAKAATNSSNPITNKTAIRIQKDPPKKSIFIYNVFWVLIFFFLILSLCYLCYTEIMADIKSKRYAGVCCLLSAVLVLVHLQ